MAAVIRLYRRFYHIVSDGTNESYNLIDPIAINASSFIKDSSTLVETVSQIKKEGLGIYYVDLSPILYSYDNSYDLKWSVQYLENKPTKILTTTFKLNPLNIAGEITTEIENQELQYDINDVQIIEVIIS